MLSVDFPGRQELMAQVDLAGVRVVCPICPTIEFEVPTESAPRAQVLHQLPVEAEVRNEAGATHLLLHVGNDGYLSRLEVYNDRGDAPNSLPEPTHLALIVHRE